MMGIVIVAGADEGSTSVIFTVQSLATGFSLTLTVTVAGSDSHKSLSVTIYSKKYSP